MDKIKTIYKHFLLLGLVLIAGILVRFYFQIGHIFSDDAYYSYLSYTLYQNNYTNDYLGYPIFPLRVGFIFLTTCSMEVFGTDEFATLFFPFFFSILNILLVYRLTDILTKNIYTALIASLLLAFFPTDIVFASIGFPDLINIFFINLGIYWLIKSFIKNKIYLSYLGGFSLFLSMQFKETSYYVLILLIILLGYLFIKNKEINYLLLTGIIFIVGNYLFEGFIYLLLQNDFFYRVTITNINYQYSFYDFFPYTAQKYSHSKHYLRNLVDQLFLINTKSVFLRRFYLLLPLVSVIQTYFSIKKSEHKLLLFWFWGTAILLIAFTTSFTEYKPLDLARSWYIYPLLIPIIILSAIFINRFSNSIRIGLMVIYTIGSIIMCFQYEKYFDNDNLDSLKSFIRDNPSKMIYTDHFSKYSVDLIRGYKEDNSKRVLGKDFDFTQIKNGDWILYNENHIDELKLQKYQFPDFGLLESSQFKKIISFNDFIFYEKEQ